jgi:type I restriction enzyme S subunit
MTEWREQMLSEFMHFNPRTPLLKGSIAKKVAMEHLASFNRKIQGYEEGIFKGGAKFKNGDTLVARITPCLENGKTAYVDFLSDNEVAFGSTEFIVLRAKEGISDSKFIFYLAISDEFRDTAIQLMTGSSGRQRVETEALKQKVFILPALPEQKAIAEVLSSLDDKIDLLTRQNKTLEDLAQAYFRKWFIEDASNKWEKKSLGEIVTINYGKALPERERVSGKIPVYSSAGVTGWHNQYLVNSRGIVIGRKGTIGTIYWVPEPFYCIDTAYYITPEDSKYDLTFIYFLLKTMSLQDLNEDSAVPGLNRNTIYSQEFLQPPDDLICKFIRLSNTLLQKIQSNTAQIHALSKLRDTLLPKLISGEIRVKM